MARQQYNTSRRRRRRSALGRIVTFLVICLVLFLGVTVFFRVNEIVVDGDTRYTDREVIEASGLTIGAHMLLIREDAVRSGILNNLPYAGLVEFRRQFPSRVTLTVTDAVAVALVHFEDGYLLLDRGAQILERVDTRPAEGLILLEGLQTPILPRVGQVLALGEEGRAQLVYLQDILGTFWTLGLTSRVSVLDMQEVHNPQFIYGERLTVLLGPHHNLQRKLDMLSGIVAYLDEDERGVIDLNPERPVFRAE